VTDREPLLIDARLEARWHRTITRRVPGSRVVTIGENGRPTADASGARIAFPFTSDAGWLRGLVRAVPSLRYLHFPFAGMEEVLAARLPAHLLTTSSAGVYAIPIAEHAVAFILALARRLPLFWDQQRRRRWRKAALEEVSGRRVGIFGYGGIGREIARRCAALGMEVWGLRRTGAPDPHAIRMLRASQLHRLLAASDYLVIAAPLTPQTRGRIDGAALRRMKPGSYLLNVSRGAIVDESALVEALRSGHLAGAYLDVVSAEPVPRWSPLWRAPHCYLTPHISFSSPRSPERMVELFCENAARYRAGKPVLNRVERGRGY